jgi:hypothetical protein
VLLVSAPGNASAECLSGLAGKWTLLVSVGLQTAGNPVSIVAEQERQLRIT